MIMRKRLVVSGHVQGVCFRYYTQERARSLGLTGWVRNRHDGAVEIVAEGHPEALTRLEQWCANGPVQARVTGVAGQALPATQEFTAFTISH